MKASQFSTFQYFGSEGGAPDSMRHLDVNNTHGLPDG
jgi:hypothetical protein